MQNERLNLHLANILVIELLGEAETIMMRIAHILAISPTGVINRY